MGHTMLDYEAPVFRRVWHPVACERDITDGPVAVELLGIPLVLARLGTEVACFYDRCVHRGMPLSAGRVCDGMLQCGYHGYAFGPDGGCARIPGLEPAGIPAGARLRKPHGIALRYGLVWVTLDEPIRPIPALPDFDDPRFHCDIAGPMRWAADAATVLDNFLDLSHFGFVHAKTFGSADSPPAQVTIRAADLDFSFESEHVGRKATAGGLKENEASSNQEYRRRLIYNYVAPFCVDLKLDFVDSPMWDRIFIAVQPETRSTARVYKLILNRFPLDSEERQRERSYQRQVNAEDQRAVELVGPRGFSLDLSAQLHTPLDAPTVALRRSLKKLIELGAERASTDSPNAR